MKIIVRVIGILRDSIAEEFRDSEIIELQLDPRSTAVDVLQRLNFPINKRLLIAHNGRMLNGEKRAFTELVEADQLTIMPPIAGG